jgi:hypothetical protein
MPSPATANALPIVPLGPDDAEAVLRIDAWASAEEYDDVDVAPTLASFEWDRSFGPGRQLGSAGRAPVCS